MKKYSWQIGLCLCWIALFVFTGLVFSGFHFFDDHEVFSILKELDTKSVSQVANEYLNNDLNYRFRPFYFPYRVLLISTFGENFIAYYLHNLVVCTLASLCLFGFAKRLNFDSLQAACFAILPLSGMAFAVFYRLGVNETTGILFLSIGLYLLALKNKWGAFLGFVAASFCKESFVLLLPGLVLLALYLENGFKTKILFFDFLKKNFIFIALMAIVFLAEIYIIIFKVGTNKIGYAGAPTQLNFALLISFLKSCTRLFVMNNAFVLLPLFLLWKFKFKQILKHWDSGFILAILLLPQLLLYAKSGMYERYLLPSTLVLALAVLFASRALKSTIWVLYFMVLSSLGMAFYQVRKYTNVGYEVNAFLRKISESTTEKSAILVVGQPYTNGEWMLSMNRFLSHKTHLRSNSVYKVLPEKGNFELGSLKLPVYNFKQAKGDFQQESFELLVTQKENLPNIKKQNPAINWTIVFEGEEYVALKK